MYMNQINQLTYTCMMTLYYIFLMNYLSKCLHVIVSAGFGVGGTSVVQSSPSLLLGVASVGGSVVASEAIQRNN